MKHSCFCCFWFYKEINVEAFPIVSLEVRLFLLSQCKNDHCTFQYHTEMSPPRRKSLYCRGPIDLAYLFSTSKQVARSGNCNDGNRHKNGRHCRSNSDERLSSCWLMTNLAWANFNGGSFTPMINPSLKAVQCSKQKSCETEVRCTFYSTRGSTIHCLHYVIKSSLTQRVNIYCRDLTMEVLILL